MAISTNPKIGDNHQPSTDIDSRVEGLSGGDKQLWLRIHRDEVLEYYHKHGPDDCMTRFNMREYTLRNFLISKPINYESFTKVDRALMKADQAIEAFYECRRRINDIEAELEETLPMVQIAYGFLDAIARATPILELAQARKKEDPLNLSDFGGKSGKRS